MSLDGGKRDMNWDVIAGNWEQLKGRLREKWGLLTDNDLESIKGRRDRLEGLLQERYGLEKDKANRDLDAFLRDLA
jgi:uncharacterized protein YjbJ (UPF0337 family)